MTKRRRIALALNALVILGLIAAWFGVPELRASWHKALMTYEDPGARQERLERLSGTTLNLGTLGAILQPRGWPDDSEAVCASVMAFALGDENWYCRELAIAYLTSREPLSLEARSALELALGHEEPALRKRAFMRLTRDRYAHWQEQLEAYEAWEKAGRPKL